MALTMLYQLLIYCQPTSYESPCIGDGLLLLTRSHALLCSDIRFCFSCHVTAAERSLCSVSILHLGYET